MYFRRTKRAALNSHAAAFARRAVRFCPAEQPPDSRLPPRLRAALGQQIGDALGHRPLDEPAGRRNPFKSTRVQSGAILVGHFAVDFGLVPFRAAHDVVVIVAEDVAIEAGFVEDLGVDVGVVGDVADVQDARHAAVTGTELLQPGGPLDAPLVRASSRGAGTLTGAMTGDDSCAGDVPQEPPCRAKRRRAALLASAKALVAS